MFEVLADTGALPRVMPELVYETGVGEELAQAARAGLPLAARYAILCRLSPDAQALSKRIRAPSECASYAVLLRELLQGMDAANAESVLALMERCDVMRKPERFTELLQAAACVRPVDLTVWLQRVQAVRSVDAGALARECSDRSRIPETVRAARLQALQAAM